VAFFLVLRVRSRLSRHIARVVIDEQVPEAPQATGVATS
jgi:hypothetical protein